MGFLTPWFLGGLIALGVPVFVHLLKRHVTVPRPVGSLMFFERGTQSSTRHRRLHYLLLFALRSALLLLIVLAFANPFVRRPASDPGGRLMMIVLDRSFSMRAGSHFDQARQQAAALLAGKPAAQRAQIVALGGQVQVLTQPTGDASQLREALQSIDAGDGRASFGELGRVVRTLQEQSHLAVDLHLFSDMQKSAMPANFADMVLPPDVKLVVHATAVTGPQSNWTVTSVDAPAELPDPKDTRRSRAIAVVEGFGTPAAAKNVTLFVNGRAAATKLVEIPANGRATVEFAPLEVGYGFNRCEVRVEGADAFPQDDSSLFAVRRSDPERVLLVRPNGDTRSELYFGAALSSAAQAAFTLQTVAAPQAADLDPSRFAFVVLADAMPLSPIFERNLRDYVVKGGSVLIALGPAAGKQAAIALWGSNVKDVHAYARQGSAATVGQVDFSYPPLADAQPGRDNGGWAGVKILSAGVADEAGARVAARLNDGTPLLLDRSLGEGHVALLATGLDNLSNDLPLHPVFVAFIDRMARYLSGAERLSGSRPVGSFLQLRAAGTGAAAQTAAEVVDPDGRRPFTLEQARTAQAVRLDRAGFYQVRFASGKDAVIGVNPDRLESNLQPMPADMQELWSGSSAGSAPGAAQSAAEGPALRPVSLWWWVVLLALAVAVAEIAIAGGTMGTQREDA